MSYQPIMTDTGTGAAVTIDWAHHEIHAGHSYFYADAVTLGVASQDYLITTPNSTPYAHMIIHADGTEVTSFSIYEAGDRAGTTGQTIYNSNRNSATASVLTIHKGTSGGTTDGTLVSYYASGSAHGSSAQSATITFSNEIILKKNTKYIFRTTSGTAGNLCNIRFSWYEHTA